MDRETNLMAIKGVLVLQQPVDPSRLRELLISRLVQRFPRFAQRVRQDDQGAWWEPDPQFRVEHHLRRRRLPAGDPAEQLQRLVSRLSHEPLDPRRPLWCVDFIPRYGTGSAVVVRVHHCIADGIALVGVMLSLTDAQSAVESSDPQADPAAPSPRGRIPRAPDPRRDPWSALLDPLTQSALDSLETAQAMRRQFERISADPLAAQRLGLQGAALAAEVLKLLVLPHDSDTRFKGRTGRAKQVAWSPALVLPEVKALARYLDCSVNDVLLTCVAGALRRYLLELGDDTQGVEIRSMVPVSLRRGRLAGELGNRFGLVTLLLPLHEAHPLHRLRLLQARMRELKSSMLPPLSLGLLGLMGLAPESVQGAALELLASKATAVMTNVPGPQSPRYLAGSRIDELLFWVPQSGDIGLGVSILSYAGSVQFGLITDEGLVPDPQRITPMFVQEFEALLLGVLMAAPEDAVTRPSTDRSSCGTAPAPARRGKARPATSPDTPRA